MARTWEVGPGQGSVACTLELAIESPAEIALQVMAAHRPGRVIQDHLGAVNNGQDLVGQQIAALAHGRQYIVRAEPGSLTVTYRGAVVPAGHSMPELVTQEQRIIALRPSRYCPSDRLTGFANTHFGALRTPIDKARAICEYVWRHVAYEPGATGPTHDAIETLLVGRGVCR